jgi:ABC-2 type transport system permease protein
VKNPVRFALVGTLAAEWIKLQTTKSLAWSAVVAAVLGIGFAMVQASTVPPDTSLPPERAAIGAGVFGVLVLMILAALTVTGEYRSGTIRTTFQAVPNRPLVLCSKALVTAVSAGMFTAVIVVASIAVARAVAGASTGSRLSLAQATTWRPVGALAIYAAVGAVLAVGLGALLRHAAGVVAVLLLLPFVVEPILGALPIVGSRVGPLLPFVNAFAFTRVPWFQTFPMHWGPWGSLAYFTGITSVVFAAAVLVINRRDA